MKGTGHPEPAWPHSAVALVVTFTGPLPKIPANHRGCWLVYWTVTWPSLLVSQPTVSPGPVWIPPLTDTLEGTLSCAIWSAMVPGTPALAAPRAHDCAAANAAA